MKEKIIAYLSGPRPYREGIALYEEYGLNLMLKATFRRNAETDLLRATLMEELHKLAGISETAFRTTPGNAPGTTRAKGRDRAQDGTVTSWKRKTGRTPATAPQQLGRKAVTEPKPGRAKAGARQSRGAPSDRP